MNIISVSIVIVKLDEGKRAPCPEDTAKLVAPDEIEEVAKVVVAKLEKFSFTVVSSSLSD
jgi:hypothetical protein